MGRLYLSRITIKQKALKFLNDFRLIWVNQNYQSTMRYLLLELSKIVSNPKGNEKTGNKFDNK